MILMSQWREFGADIKEVSPKNYKEIGSTFGVLQNWKNRGYSTILDVLMVIMIHNACKLKHYNQYLIIF